ncbi:alpha/beta hydrolase [Stenotrophomonas maltophilia]|uniref:alpha/beta hydrolase family protein n=1 Tax=Stenotrophomonas maltophilia TaxID=40324 RepID=UPI0021C7629D|nr:alpha/beta hydrolase [Stenotrophomonas maltophilia]MCU1202461.1 alpha/beta hydrolase [Stenotrophomonas maltophilia]
MEGWKSRSLLSAVLVCSGLPAAAADLCAVSAYGDGQGNIVVLGAPAAAPATGQRYLMLDGRRGATGDANAPVSCSGDVVSVSSPAGATQRWQRLSTRDTDATFTSAGTKLVGQLIEPAGPADPKRPLVVLVHGSERTMAVAAIYQRMLVAQGISVFAYQKRGTGDSEGEYTQNFELLADDAAAALAKARELAKGRFGRAGYFGGSQGGWIAPLAATRSQADFVAIGFGLVVSPIEEDREQLFDEAHRLQLDPAAMKQVGQLSDATAQLMRAHFSERFEALAKVRAQVGAAPWAKTISGEFSGDMLRMSDADLRRIGRARFDNLELIWDYDAEAALQRLKVPLLWVLAEQDRAAPIAATRTILGRLRGSGQPIETYLFPDTDHGMVEFRTDAEGNRVSTRITDGYLRLLADWIKQDVHGQYGRARTVSD